jgi:deazaflavin-dependent oxidoreductase (nitroreductase family)
VSHDDVDYNRGNIAEFRASGGRIASFGTAPVLLLTTTGARSGEPRTAPMMYLADADDPARVYVFASNDGRDADPAWVHNIRAQPHGLTVEIGDRTFTAEAEELGEPRRSEIFDVQAERYSAFRTYQDGTDRTIPVVALTLHS